MQSKIKSIKVKVKSKYDSHTKTTNSGHFDKTLKIDWFSGAAVSGFDIEVTVTDKNGNVRKKTKHLSSFFGWISEQTQVLNWIIDEETYDELSHFPKYNQKDKKYCAYMSFLEIVHYYGNLYDNQVLKDETGPFDEDNCTIQWKSGDDDPSGMNFGQQMTYVQHPTIQLYETVTEDDDDGGTSMGEPTFTKVKNEILNADPIFATFYDYYGNAIFLFKWSKVPGDDNKKLRDAVKRYFNFKWAKKANITKAGNTVWVTDRNNASRFVRLVKGTYHVDAYHWNGSNIGEFDVQKYGNPDKIYREITGHAIVIVGHWDSKWGKMAVIADSNFNPYTYTKRWSWVLDQGKRMIYLDPPPPP